ncbi:hypothetical protein PoB_000526300 [Plakobranchus ocellatus]|uniref:Uncharacterized protein n=1 Tax=Plakobranchus ocellatus TaxID=259542 RepID=A0AAV3Y9D0_9GAST|nr:hypothetical protein PoB_000526300 [Plakobranchus ocellatus]
MVPWKIETGMRPYPHPPGKRGKTTRRIDIATRPRTTIMQKDKEVGKKEGKASGPQRALSLEADNNRYQYRGGTNLYVRT